jgi:hypothetical protein
MRKLGIAAASAMLGLAVAFSTAVPTAWAGGKVDCDAVMQELNSGKKVKEVATDMKISTSSVYRCRKKAKQAAKAETKSQKMTGKMEGATAAGAGASPAAAASPAAKK